MGALLAGSFNVRALKRARSDAWVVALAMIVAVAVVLLAADATLSADNRSVADASAGVTASAARKKSEHILLFGHEISRPLLRRLVQATGLLVFLAFFLRHRRFHRALALASAEPARPWAVGLGCVGAGWVLQYTVTVAYIGLR